MLTITILNSTRNLVPVARSESLRLVTLTCVTDGIPVRRRDGHSHLTQWWGGTALAAISIQFHYIILRFTVWNLLRQTHRLSAHLRKFSSEYHQITAVTISLVLSILISLDICYRVVIFYNMKIYILVWPLFLFSLQVLSLCFLC